MPDFEIHPYGNGDTALQPVTVRAAIKYAEIRDVFGREAFVAVIGGPRSLFVETSRSPQYLTDTIHDLRAQGFTVARAEGPDPFDVQADWDERA